jgi:hypothetical protein
MFSQVGKARLAPTVQQKIILVVLLPLPFALRLLPSLEVV